MAVHGCNSVWVIVVSTVVACGSGGVWMVVVVWIWWCCDGWKVKDEWRHRLLITVDVVQQKKKMNTSKRKIPSSAPWFESYEHFCCGVLSIWFFPKWVWDYWFISRSGKILLIILGVFGKKSRAQEAQWTEKWNSSRHEKHNGRRSEIWATTSNKNLIYYLT